MATNLKTEIRDTTMSGASLTPICETCGTTCEGSCPGACDGHCAPEREAGDSRGSRVLVLPIAPRATLMARYGCPTNPVKALSPADVPAFMDHVLKSGARPDPVTRVELRGPGDPLATLESTLETVRVIRDVYPELEITLATPGMNAAESASLLAEAGLKHVTLIMDALYPETAARLHAWIRPGRKTLPVAKAAEILVQDQEEAIRALNEAGLTVRVRTTAYMDENHEQIPELAGKVAELGAEAMELAAFTALGDSDVPTPSPLPLELLTEIRELAGKHLPVLDPPPVTLPGCACGGQDNDLLENWRSGATRPIPQGNRPNVAVASADGFEINLHVGQTTQFLIYGKNAEGLVVLLGGRAAPAPGSEDRWDELAKTLKDCAYLVASGAGERPTRILNESGLRILISDGQVEGLVDTLYGGGKKGRGKR